MSQNVIQFKNLKIRKLDPINLELATTLLKESGITRGVCIDIGCGYGELGLSIAKKCPSLEVFLVDINEEMVELVDKRIEMFDLRYRVNARKDDICHFSARSNTVHLIVSKGSISFWDDTVMAINEIYRCLKKGGKAYIGYGTDDRIAFENGEFDTHFDEHDGIIGDTELSSSKEKTYEQVVAEKLHEFMEESCVPSWRITSKIDDNVWAVFEKSENK